jgi:ABC-2 type transport system ATP-binding protein
MGMDAGSSNSCLSLPPALFARGLHKRLGTTAAVAGVDLSVRRGEVIGLLGANGAGKTTLLHLIAGILAPDAGSIEIAGEADPTKPRVRRALGFAPQATAVYDELSSVENLHFFGSVHGLSRATLKTRIEHGLAFAGLLDRRDDRVGTFSGGLKRRLHVACALVHSPALLLLDEPTVGVDAASRGHLLDGVAALRKEGCAVIYASHHLDEVARVCDRVVVLSHGKVIAEDRLDRIDVDLEALLRTEASS